jgi:Uma2 family endonuclease
MTWPINPRIAVQRPRTRGVLARYMGVKTPLSESEYLRTNYEGPEPDEVPESSPLIAIEVLSPDDSHTELMRKFADYAALGVPDIWLVDPIARRFSTYHDESLSSTQQFEMPSYGVLIRPSDIFRAPK